MIVSPSKKDRVGVAPTLITRCHKDLQALRVAVHAADPSRLRFRRTTFTVPTYPFWRLHPTNR